VREKLTWTSLLADHGRHAGWARRVSPERFGRILLSRRRIPRAFGRHGFVSSDPLGQTLFVTSGIGWVQTWGGPVREIRAGDTVWIPPGEKHWHGATADHSMEHIAMQEAQGGEHVTWLEPVTDAQYSGKGAG